MKTKDERRRHIPVGRCWRSETYAPMGAKAWEAHKKRKALDLLMHKRRCRACVN